MKSEFSQKLHKETQISLVTRAVETDMIIFIQGMDGTKRGQMQGILYFLSCFPVK